MSPVKEAAIRLIQSLPDDCTWEDVRSQLAVVAEQGTLALPAARALAVANRAALAQGMNPIRNVVGMTADGSGPSRVWTVHYGSASHLRRGGDLLVFIDDHTGTVRRTIKGQ
jgi:hypothetical protein